MPSHANHREPPRTIANGNKPHSTPHHTPPLPRQQLHQGPGPSTRQAASRCRTKMTSRLTRTTRGVKIDGAGANRERRD